MKNKFIYSKNNKCSDCGKEIHYKSKRCCSCANRRKNLGRKMSKENKQKLRQSNIGNKYNLKHGETIKKHSCFLCGCSISTYSALYGQGRCGSCSRKGKYNGNYIDGRTSLQIRIHSLSEYKSWRTEIFKRDNYTCRECDKRGCKLEAHHKKSFKELFIDFLAEYDQFNPIEDKETLARLAMKYKPFWNIDNGKTLCKECHKLKRRKKHEKLTREKFLEDKFESFKEQLKKYLPEEAYEAEFEDIFHAVRELFC